MKMSLATAPGSVIEVEITFHCLEGHEIRRRLPAVKGHGTHRRIQDQMFESLHCKVCGWTGDKWGSKSADIQVVDQLLTR